MRVNLAAQVLSRTVAAGIFTHSTLGLLPPEAVHTAEFIYKIDQLFDLFNSATKEHFKEVQGAMKDNTGHLHFIREMITYIQYNPGNYAHCQTSRCTVSVGGYLICMP